MANRFPSGDQLRIGEVIRVQVTDAATGQKYDLQYTQCKIVGRGSFGVVYQTKLSPGNEDAAIKRVLQDKRFKNRELQILKSVRHRNVVELKAYYYMNGERKDELYLHLVQEFLPETLYRASRYFIKVKGHMPMIEIKNLLLDPNTGVLKLCDFGSAKKLIDQEPNVSYICSRYYRAPELIFGATIYTTKIDVWSTGCVMAELMLGQPLFPGESGIDQLVEIIKVLGTPSREQIGTMNPNYVEHRFPQIKPQPFKKVFRPKTEEASIELIEGLLQYTPAVRLSAIQAMAHHFFDELRDPNTTLPNTRNENAPRIPLPPLFDFSLHELSIAPELNSKLVPPHMVAELKKNNLDITNFTPMPREQMLAKLD